jgi:hypothetical protein
MKKFYKKFIFPFTLYLLLLPAPSWAWRDYTYQDGDWHGSGRDYAYSYYLDNYYGDGRAGHAPLIDDEAYFNTSPTPSITPVEFTVNVPNRRGGYTPVVIKKSGSGWIGPQGEFYPQFPKVSTLKAIYGN